MFHVRLNSMAVPAVYALVGLKRTFPVFCTQPAHVPVVPKMPAVATEFNGRMYVGIVPIVTEVSAPTADEYLQLI